MLGTDVANFALLVAHNGMGKDIWTVSPENITMMLKVSPLLGDGNTVQSCGSNFVPNDCSLKRPVKAGRLCVIFDKADTQNYRSSGSSNSATKSLWS